MKKLLRKNKFFMCCLLAELVLLLILAGGMLLRQNKVYCYGGEGFTDNGAGSLVSEKLVLSKGIYKVKLSYTCDGDMQDFCIVEDAGAGSLLCSGEHLSGGRGYTDFDLWIKAADTEAVVNIACGGDNLQINGLEICQTDRDFTRGIFLLLVVSLLLDTLLGLRIYEDAYGIPREKKLIGAGLVAVIAVSSIPALVNYAYPGSDITYHLLRIGNLKDGLLSGQFPVRIDPSWLWGHGYANSVCYGELLFYFPAFLRLIGFTLQGSYLLFLVALNIATCLISYFSFKWIFHSGKAGFFCSVLYTLSIYRLYKMYSWGALGEVQGMLFLPLVLYAVYAIFTEDVKGRAYGKKWIPLAIGFAGITQCHILTLEMTVFFLAVACIVLWKRLFRKETFPVFVKGVAGTLALSAWFLVPFLDYYLNVDMVIHHVSARTIQAAGLYPANLLFAFFHRGSSRDFATYGMQDMEALGVGITMTVSALLFLGMWFWGYLGKRKQADGLLKDAEQTDSFIKGGKLAVILGVLAMVMSLAIFPWTKIQFASKFTEMLVSSIQYPNRFLMIATVLLTFVAGVTVVVMGRRFSGRMGLFGGGGLAAMAVLTAAFYMSSIVSDAGSLYMYDEKGMGTGYLSGAEYLRYGANQGMFSYHGAVPGEGVEINGYEKEWLDIDLNVANNGGVESYVEIPLQNYKGYQATAAETGERFTICDGDNFDVRIILPAGFVGEIQVRFIAPWYWRAAELVSAVMVVCLAVYGVKGRQKRSKEAGKRGKYA